MECPRTATVMRVIKQRLCAPLGSPQCPSFHVRPRQLPSPAGTAWHHWTQPPHASATSNASSQQPPFPLPADEQTAPSISPPRSSLATNPNNGLAAAVSPDHPVPNGNSTLRQPVAASGEVAAAAHPSTAPAPAAGPLLPAGSPSGTGPSGVGGDAGSSGGSTTIKGGVKSPLETAWDLTTLALPLATQNVLGYSLNALSEGLVGRLGPTTLSASTLANSTYSLLGLSLAWGGAVGMETLCGQAHGAGKARLMWLVLVRAVLVCWAVCVPLVWLLSGAEPLLLALGQSPALVGQSAAYLKALCPALFCYVLSECLQTYMVVQGHVRATTGAKAAVTLLGPVYYWACMFRLDLGLVGAAYAYALCRGTNAALLLGWMALRGGGRGSSSGGEGNDARACGSSDSMQGGTNDMNGSVDGSSRSGSNNSNSNVISDNSNGYNNSHDFKSSVTPDSERCLHRSTDHSHVNGSDPDPSGGDENGGSVVVTRGAHREMLTSSLPAAASARDLSSHHLPSTTASDGSSGGAGGGGGCGESAAVAAGIQPVDARASAAAAVTVASSAAVVGGRALVSHLGSSSRGSGGLYSRVLVAAAAVRRDVAEVLDPGGCWEYVKFGLPAAVMSCLEWWAYEALVIMAGWLPNADVALGCLGICLTVGGWVYMVPQAVATAVCSRVANALGAGDAEAAKRTFQAGYCLALLTQLAISAALLTHAASVAACFCPDPTVAALTATLLPITAINTIGDGLNCVLNGVLRACGRQSLGARLHLAAYWACGLPLVYLAAFKAGMGVRGVVVAIGATSFVQSLVVGGLISRLDWGREVRRSRALLSSMGAA